MNRKQQLDRLITELSPNTALPPDAEGKWRLFRALVNIRKPIPVSNDFLATQDELLLMLIAEKGITDINSPARRVARRHFCRAANTIHTGHNAII